MKPIKIIKNRSDIGAGARGSDLGIDALEIAAINKENDYFDRYEFVDIETKNESIYNKVKNSFAKRIQHVAEQCERVSNETKKTLEENKFPIVLSGDHSSALGTISGIKAAYPDKELGVIWIDAHADIHSPYSSPSGNVHGMPLAAAIGDDNSYCQINIPTPETELHWNKMKNTGIDGPKINPQNLVYFGVRDTEFPEEYQMTKFEIRNYKVAEIRHRGLNVCIAETLEKLKNCDHLYISFDVDSMDCDSVSYGTGTPVPNGFDPKEIVEIINGIITSHKVACIELVEINPLLDTKANKMAETAFDILDQITENLS
ncbi:arginase [Bacteroidota bacterium]